MELIQFSAADGVELHGVIHPAESRLPVGSDAAIFLHGAGSNFYGSSLMSHLLPACGRLGMALLSINTRGHDLACTLRSPSGGCRGGAAFEIVDECRHDIRGQAEGNQCD